MRTWGRRHRWLSSLLAAALLFAQLAAAAYACPRQDAAPVAGSMMADCAGHRAAAMDPEAPLLCKAHCAAGQQSVNSNAGAAAQVPPALIAAIWVRLPEVADAALLAAALPQAQAAGPPAGTPPLYLSLLVLRN